MQESLSYIDQRINTLNNIDNIDLYPHKFHYLDYELLSTNRYHFRYTSINSGEHLENDKICLMGRIYSIRSSSKNLFFFDLIDEGCKVQIMANRKLYKDIDTLFFSITSSIKAGDYLGIRGYVAKTKLGELTLIAHSIQILAPCLHMLPRGTRIDNNGNEHNGLKDLDNRFRKRYLDMIVNDNVRDIFITRSKIIKFIRHYLEDLEFIEVDTPILDVQSGGAIAKPFQTFSNDFNIPMYMRIAPELYLKRLVIGGLNKVFEIGRQFRNESNDLTHNCEFTSIELYWRNADYNDLMTINEDLFKKIVLKINGSYKLNLNTDISIDFEPSFDKIDMIPTLEKKINIKFPHPTQFESTDFNDLLDSICTKNNIECSKPRTTSRLLDKLVGFYIEPYCINPTFIYGHPQIMSPLAKWDRNRPGLTERFELFINGIEYANAYTELNDPKVQLECFKNQDKFRNLGDEEAQPPDYSYIEALEHGLPPTGGWGCGIDRLCMLLNNVTSIREVILFPTMKPIISSN